MYNDCHTSCPPVCGIPQPEICDKACNQGCGCPLDINSEELYREFKGSTSCVKKEDCQGNIQCMQCELNNSIT